MAHEVHPKKIVKTEKGNIVMETPDMFRKSALSNSIYSYVLTEKDLLSLNEIANEKERNEFIHIRTLKKGFTMMQLTLLSYVTSAPFHLNDYREEPVFDLNSFIEFLDDKTMNDMINAMKELGTIDPLSA